MRWISRGLAAALVAPAVCASQVALGSAADVAPMPMATPIVAPGSTEPGSHWPADADPLALSACQIAPLAPPSTKRRPSAGAGDALVWVSREDAGVPAWTTFRVGAGDSAGVVLSAEPGLQLAADGHVWSSRVEGAAAPRARVPSPRMSRSESLAKGHDALASRSVLFVREDGQQKRTVLDLDTFTGDRPGREGFADGQIVRSLGPYLFLRMSRVEFPCPLDCIPSASVEATVLDIRTGDVMAPSTLFYLDNQQGESHLDEFDAKVGMPRLNLADILDERGRFHELLSGYAAYLANAGGCAETLSDVQPSTELLPTYGASGGLAIRLRFLPGTCLVWGADDWVRLAPSESRPFKTIPSTLSAWSTMPPGVAALAKRLPPGSLGGFSVL